MQELPWYRHWLSWGVKSSWGRTMNMYRLFDYMQTHAADG